MNIFITFLHLSKGTIGSATKGITFLLTLLNIEGIIVKVKHLFSDNTLQGYRSAGG